MLNYEKMIEWTKKKLQTCVEAASSDENDKKIERYSTILANLMKAEKMEHGEKHEKDNPGYSEETTQIYMAPDMSIKSEFEKTVWEVFKSKPSKETANKLIKEIDVFVDMMKSLHQQRYQEFITKLKEMK